MRPSDTTFLIDLLNGEKRAEQVAKTVDEEKSPAALSAISVHEYLLGVHLASKGEKALEGRLASARKDLERFEVIPLTQEVAEASAKIHASLIREGRQIGINDACIAATALRYNLKLVSRNQSHFQRIKGLNLEGY